MQRATMTRVGTSVVLLLAVSLLAATVSRAADAAKTTTSTTKTTTTTTTPPPAPKPMTMKEVKQKLGMVVFPAKEQTPEKQETDEYDCLMWSADQAGINNSKPADPKAAGDAAAAHVDSVAAGAAVKGAAKGAAAGALIGSISGNSGSGAAYGAAAGAVAGRRAKKSAKADAAAQAEAQANAANQAKLDAVKKGMTACLESKGYTIK